MLGFGLGSRLAQRATWQERTREQLVNLTQGMRLASSAVPAVTVTLDGPETGPLDPAANFPPERDDDYSHWPDNYRVQKLRFSFLPGNRFDPARPAPARSFTGYLARPTTPPPPGGYRVMVAVNGHGGSAQQLLQRGNAAFWHGESAARRGLAVLAIDIGHRPEWNDVITHPAIIGAGYATSDWEEDGERAFSVSRAIDYLSTVPNMRLDRIFIAGLSMGGEVASIVGAHDPRLAMVIAAGYSPDLFVLDVHGSHGCWRWTRSDIHEYVGMSDYLGMTAPRLLVVETGVQDFTFSGFPTPFTSDKQVVRRARVAYGADVANLVHYLHYDAHRVPRRRPQSDDSVTAPRRARGRAERAVEPNGPELADEQHDFRAQPHALPSDEREPALASAARARSPAGHGRWRPQTCEAPPPLIIERARRPLGWPLPATRAAAWKPVVRTSRDASLPDTALRCAGSLGSLHGLFLQGLQGPERRLGARLRGRELVDQCGVRLPRRDGR